MGCLLNCNCSTKLPDLVCAFELHSCQHVVHFDDLFLESALKLDDFLLVLFGHIGLVDVGRLFVFLLLLLSQELNIVNESSLLFILTFVSLCNALVHCVHQQDWVFDSRLDHRPELFDQETQAGALLFRLLYLLIEKLLAVFEQLDQLFVFTLELFDFFNVSALFLDLLVDDLLLLEQLLLKNTRVLSILVVLGRCLVPRAASHSSAFAHVE